MPVPPGFMGRLRVPVIAAPMFLISDPALVVAACRAGVVGTFPALNVRRTEDLALWLSRIDDECARHGPVAPYGVNLILHAGNVRLESDLAIVAQYRVPFVITSLGHPGAVVEAVHAYGGLVFSDVVNAYHARKAAEAGVDGIIAIAAGAGGHAGTQSPFSLVREIRQFWDGVLVLGGAISDGFSVRAAEVMGADFAYLGTRFIATQEAAAQSGYKEMLVASGMRDIVYTAAVSGTAANFMLPSLERAGYSAAMLASSPQPGKLQDLNHETRAWRDIWSAGHGVACIDDVPSVADLVDRLVQEYRAACVLPSSAAIADD